MSYAVEVVEFDMELETETGLGSAPKSTANVGRA